MRMNRILDIDLDDRFAVVEAGVTNIGITNAVAGDGFFYAPDPSSQLACMINQSNGSVQVTSLGLLGILKLHLALMVIGVLGATALQWVQVN
jgi:glycolate oxidase